MFLNGNLWIPRIDIRKNSLTNYELAYSKRSG